MQEFLLQLNEMVSAAVWGLPMIIALVCTGAYFTVKSRAFQIRRLGTILRSTLGSISGGSRDGASPFKAMATALAGSAGTGNIVGVSAAIAAGGPGAVFWMCISGLLGMMIKFAEVCLAVKYRKKTPDGWRGGPMYYIDRGLGGRFHILAVIFAAVCALASFGVGNMTQVNAAAVSLEESFGVPPLCFGIGMALLTALVIFGGMTRIYSIAGFVVPFMSLFYIAGAVVVIGVNFRGLPAAVSGIFTGAFGLRQAGGGVIGYTAAQAVRFGVSRGVFTNEAGMGSSPIAHAGADTPHPAAQGMWGAAEVFIDTVIVCTVTALAILSSPEYISGAPVGNWELASAAFTGVMGPFGGYFISASLVLFSFATVIGWSYYGQCCVEYLFGKGRRAAVFVYRAAYVLCAAAGAVSSLDALWTLADTLNGLMAIPNLIAVVMLSGRVFELMEEYFPRSVSLGEYRRTGRCGLDRGGGGRHAHGG